MTAVSGLLGLACRAGQITLGSEMTIQEIRSGRAGLVLLDEGASEGTSKKISDACAYRQILLHRMPEGEISRACGKEGRMAAAIKPGKLCQQIIRLLSTPENPAINNQ